MTDYLTFPEGLCRERFNSVDDSSIVVDLLWRFYFSLIKSSITWIRLAIHAFFRCLLRRLALILNRSCKSPPHTTIFKLHAIPNFHIFWFLYHSYKQNIEDLLIQLLNCSHIFYHQCGCCIVILFSFSYVDI